VTVVLGASLALFCTLGFINAFGVFLDYYHQTLLSNKSPFDISWIGSFATFVLMLGAPVAGVLVDKTGPMVRDRSFGEKKWR
jgi:MFS family permease